MFSDHRVALLGSAANSATSDRGRALVVSVTTSTVIRGGPFEQPRR